MMSRACKKLMRPSGPMGTSVRAESSISNNWRLITSPGPRVSRCCQAASLVGAVTERERLVPLAGARAALGGESDSAAGKRHEPGARSKRQAIQRRRQLLFILEIQIPAYDSGRQRPIGTARGAEPPVANGLPAHPLCRCPPAITPVADSPPATWLHPSYPAPSPPATPNYTEGRAGILRIGGWRMSPAATPCRASSKPRSCVSPHPADPCCSRARGHTTGSCPSPRRTRRLPSSPPCPRR